MMKEQAEIEVPDVDDNKAMKSLSKSKDLQGMYDMDNIKTDDSSFKDKYSDFVVTTARVADNETFVLENVRTTRLSRLRRWKSSTGVTSKTTREGSNQPRGTPTSRFLRKTGSKKTTTLQVSCCSSLSNAGTVDGKRTS